MARSLVIGPTAAPLSYAVVTPAHDEADNLQRLADALAAQTRPPAAWVIVDTGSTDGTPELARRLVETSETTRLVHLGALGRPARGGPIVQAFHAGLDELPPGIDVVV